MARSGEGGDTEWEILLSAEIESFLDHLYESDPASHQLVNQGSWFWSAAALRRVARWLTRSRRRGSRT